MNDGDPERLRYLQQRGLVPGAHILVEASDSGLTGAVTVTGSDGTPHELLPDLAAVIYVDHDD